MDMASVHALQACNIACYDKISETMLAAASSSGAGIVLVMHVDEDGEEIKTLEVAIFDSSKLPPSPLTTWACQCQVMRILCFLFKPKQ